MAAIAVVNNGGGEGQGLRGQGQMTARGRVQGQQGKEGKGGQGHKGKGEGELTSMIASVAAEAAQGGCMTTTMMTKTPSMPAEARRSPSVGDRGKDNCGASTSTAATTTTVVKATAMVATRTNKETC